jgi:predicted RNA binding protein YcfA (HicA-like mRNA interferase family)
MLQLLKRYGYELLRQCRGSSHEIYRHYRTGKTILVTRSGLGDSRARQNWLRDLRKVPAAPECLGAFKSENWLDPLPRKVLNLVLCCTKKPPLTPKAASPEYYRLVLLYHYMRRNTAFCGIIVHIYYRQT